MSPSSAAKISPIETGRLRLAPAADQRAAALVMVLLLIAVLTVVAGSLLLTTTSHYHNTFQSASWQEAIIAAEAGVDMAMAELRKRVILGAPASFRASSWTRTGPTGKAYVDSGCAFPADNQPYALVSHGGEGNSTLSVRVFVDVPGSGVPPVYSQSNFAVPAPLGSDFISQPDDPAMRDPDGYDRSRWWYRIRSLGVAGIAGPARVNLDGRDNLLRRLSFFTDWRTGQSVASAQAARMVEVIAKPLTGFRNALMADKRIDLTSQDVLVDSYDSTKGPWDPNTNHSTKGNLATNGQLINAGGAQVMGDASTNDGSVKDAQGVTGQQRTDFYQELTPVKPLTDYNWTALPVGNTVTTDATYAASTDQSNPTRIRLSGINLTGSGYTFHVTGQPAPKGASAPPPTYVKIYVEGDIVTRGSSRIEMDNGVNAIIYVTGNVDLQGTGLLNDTTVPGNLLMKGVQPPVNNDGTYPARTINIATDQDFSGVIYAPNHDLTLALNAAPTAGNAASTPAQVAAQVTQLQAQVVNYDQQIAAAQAEYDKWMYKYNNLNQNQNFLNKANAALATLNQAKAAQAQVQQQIAAVQSVLTNSDHALGYNGVYGAFVANTITVGSKTHVHYDEALRQAGPVNHYQILSWFEDTVGTNAAGGAAFYWWAPPPPAAPQF